MRLEEDMRRCVVFLGWQKAGPTDDAAIDPRGTGFLLISHKAPGLAWLVTARHVAEVLHPPFVIRYNRKDKTAALLHVETPAQARWCFHRDPTVDIAVMPLDFHSSFEGAGFVIESMMDGGEQPQIIKDLQVGDPACVIGLFHLHHGTKANTPIVHTGHIAMLPSDELVEVDGKLVEAYLVQANAISGCSGSPVFGAPTVTLSWEGKPALMGIGTRAALIGLWSASWKVEGSRVVTVRAEDGPPGITRAPLGMGIVIPVSKVVDIMTGAEMTRNTAEMVETKRHRKSATFDGLPGAPPAT
jgi:hypothetical protein